MGLRRGEFFFSLRLTTSSAQCLRLSERFFIRLIMTMALCILGVQTTAVLADVLGRLRQKTQILLEFFSYPVDQRPLHVLGQYPHFSKFSNSELYQCLLHPIR